MNLNSPNGIDVGFTFIPDWKIVRAAWVLPLFTVFTAMTIHAVSGNARAFPFFISESDYEGLERWIFTLGLASSGVLLCITAHRFNIRFHNQDMPKRQRWSYISGWITGCSMFVLSFMNMYDYLIPHTATSIFVFGGGLSWGISTHLLVGPSSTGLNIRKFGLVIAAVGMSVLNTSMGYYLLFSKKIDFDGSSIQSTLDALQPAINFAAPGEYLLFIGLVVCMASFEREVV